MRQRGSLPLQVSWRLGPVLIFASQRLMQSSELIRAYARGKPTKIPTAPELPGSLEQQLMHSPQLLCTSTTPLSFNSAASSHPPAPAARP